VLRSGGNEIKHCKPGFRGSQTKGSGNIEQGGQYLKQRHVNIPCHFIPRCALCPIDFNHRCPYYLAVNFGVVTWDGKFDAKTVYLSAILAA
jgi:hypothetical protein